MRYIMATIVAVIAVGLTGCNVESTAEKEARADAERAAAWSCPVEPPKWADERAEYERCIDIEADRIMDEEANR